MVKGCIQGKVAESRLGRASSTNGGQCWSPRTHPRWTRCSHASADFFFKVGEQSALTDAELVGRKELYFVQFVPTPCCTLHRTCKTTCTFSREKPLMCTTWLHAFKQKAPCQRHVCTYKRWCDPCQNFVLCGVFASSVGTNFWVNRHEEVNCGVIWLFVHFCFECRLHLS